MSTSNIEYPFEVAYQIPGESWKRRVIRNQRQWERLVERLDEEGAEVRIAEGAY